MKVHATGTNKPKHRMELLYARAGAWISAINVVALRQQFENPPNATAMDQLIAIAQDHFKLHEVL